MLKTILAPIQTLVPYLSVMGHSQSTAGMLKLLVIGVLMKFSFHEAASKQSHQMQSTATGCRLTFGAPQIVGWVNQILPALPRVNGFEPMVQNIVK
jgi:hypothetical protein